VILRIADDAEHDQDWFCQAVGKAADPGGGIESWVVHVSKKPEHSSQD